MTNRNGDDQSLFIFFVNSHLHLRMQGLRQAYLFAFKIPPIAIYGQLYLFERFSESFSSHKVRFTLFWCIKLGVFVRYGALEE